MQGPQRSHGRQIERVRQVCLWQVVNRDKEDKIGLLGGHHYRCLTCPPLTRFEVDAEKCTHLTVTLGGQRFDVQGGQGLLVARVVVNYLTAGWPLGALIITEVLVWIDLGTYQVRPVGKERRVDGEVHILLVAVVWSSPF